MGLRLDGRVVLITGGATGIGAATAELVCSQGGTAVVADVNEADAAGLIRRIESRGGSVRFVRTDVTSEEEVSSLMGMVMRDIGRLDALVNGAGILLSPKVRVDDLDRREWQKTLDVNLSGTFLCTKHAVPILEKTGGGVIILIASGAGVRGPSSSLAYGASKGGIQGLAFTLEEQLAPLNIRVNVVCPAGIATPLKLRNVAEIAELSGESPVEAVEAARSELGDPDGVARILAFLVSEDASYIRGTIFTR